MAHSRKVCKHNILISQCRCPGPKENIIVSCPSHCKEKDVTPDATSQEKDFESGHSSSSE